MLHLKKKSANTKVLFLISVSSIAYLIVFICLYFFTIYQENEVKDISLNQFNNEVKTLLELNSKSNSTTISDITYWNELVDFVETKDEKWFTESIVPAISVFNTDYIGVFNLNNHLVMDKHTNKITSANFIPKTVFQKLYKNKSIRFFTQTSNGIVEVFGATIHTSNDPLKNKTNPRGYFFIATLLDNSYFNQLQKIISAKIGVVSNSANVLKKNDTISIAVPLKNEANNSVAKIVFNRPFVINFQISRIILLVIIVAFIINLFINLYYAKKWVFYPLKLVTNILEKEDKKAIKKLKAIPGEFGYIGNLVNENVLQRKMLEVSIVKAQESDELKSAFLANLSHEIRTPMNAIIGFSDLLSTNNLSESEKVSYLDVIKNSGNNLISIIDDLIEMSKIDSNLVQPNYLDININDFVEQIFNSIKITIPKNKDIQFNCIKLNKNFSKYIVTDPVKLNQVLTNLITNAIKFTNQGAVTFVFDVNEVSNKLVFKIIDSGIGIEKKELKNIFDRFKRIDGEHAIKAGGLGLGLAITKAYVNMLEGEVSVKSELLVGSEFEVILPLRIATLSSVTSNDLTQSFVSNQFKNITVLVAEDDNINFLLIDKLLKISNFTVIRAVDGEKAVEICKTNVPIDLVLMDIKMPKLNGYDAFNQICKIRPNLPVIAQTAYSSIEDKEKIVASGFSGYISKPINKEKMLFVIQEAFLNQTNKV